MAVVSVAEVAASVEAAASAGRWWLWWRRCIRWLVICIPDPGRLMPLPGLIPLLRAVRCRRHTVA